MSAQRNPARPGVSPLRKTLGVGVTLAFLLGLAYALSMPSNPPPVAVRSLAAPPKSQPQTMARLPPPTPPMTSAAPSPATPSSPPKPPPTLPEGTLGLRYSQDAELHLLGVYQARPQGDDGKPWWSKCGNPRDQANMMDCHARMVAHGREPGTVEVDVTYNEHPIILTLMAYSPVVWKVKPGYGVVIEQVILAGYHRQSVEGAGKDVPIHVYTYESSPCERCWQGEGHFYAYEKGGRDGNFGTAEKKLFEITGKRVASFQGKYQGERFAIAQGMPVLSYPAPAGR